ncbi:MAG: NUDIX domain-containing protein [Phycisphaerales bacterium]
MPKSNSKRAAHNGVHEPTGNARDEHGHRLHPLGGARLRADVIDVYIIRREGEDDRPAARSQSRLARSESFSILQLHRATGPLCATWQPVMGHIEPGETAVRAAEREVAEEIGLCRSDTAFAGMWALEQVHPYFLAALDCVVLSPRFLIEVRPSFTPRLNHEHDAWRWVHSSQAWRRFMWPGQQAALREITAFMMPAGSLARRHLAL